MPLRELLQSPHRKVSKYAQLMSVSPPARAGEPPAAPRPVGALVFEMRMRRRIDVAASAFMQQFPDVAALALTPVLPGSRDKEVVITVLQATALRLRAHGLRAAPYVHFEFFEFGEQETATSTGSDPRFEQEFRFALDLDPNLSEYLKQEVLRFTVFDENEEDAAGLLGFGTLPLARLLTGQRLDADLPLQDASLQPAGNLSVTVELRDASAPRPISLKRAGLTDTDTAAAAIQSVYRGRAVRRDGGGAMAERGSDLSLRLLRLDLAAGVADEEGISAAWVEVDLLDMTPAPLRTEQARLREAGCALDFAHTVSLKSAGSAAAALRRALSADDDRHSDVFFNVMGVGSSGAAKLIGNSYINLKELWATGRDLDEASVPVRRAQAERPIGSLIVSVHVVAAAHRAMAPGSIRIDIGVARLPDSVLDDSAIGEVWVEAELPELSGPTSKLRTNPLSKRTTPCDFKHTHTVELPPGSAATQALARAISSAGGRDADVLFILKGRGAAGSKPRDLGQAALNLAAVLRDGSDLVLAPLRLQARGGGPPAELSVSLLAVEALRRLRAPPTSAHAVRIELGKLTLIKPLLGDRSVDKLWADVEWVDGTKMLESRAVRAADAAPSLNLEFSGEVPVEEGSKAQLVLSQALASADEQQSDVYFNLNTTGREVAQGFINLQELLRSGKDLVRKPVDLITEAGVPVGSLEVSVAALPVLKRSQAPRGAGTSLKVEVGRIQLGPAVVRDGTVSEVWVEVDLPGDDLATAEEQVSKRMQKKGAELDCGFSLSIPIAPGSRALAALREAVASEQEEDADIFFALKARGAAGGAARQLGEGFVSLRTIVESGNELVAVPVALSGDAGTLSVSVAAVDALRLAGASVAAAPRAAAAGGPAPASPTLTISIGELALGRSVLDDASVGEVWLEIDLMDMSDSAQLRTERAPKRTSLSLGYSHSVAIAPGSRAMDVLRSALVSTSEGEDDVYFTLKGAGTRGAAPKTLGEAYVSLRDVLQSGREMAQTRLTLSGGAGSVTISLTALQALRAATSGAARAATMPGPLDDGAPPSTAAGPPLTASFLSGITERAGSVPARSAAAPALRQAQAQSFLGSLGSAVPDAPAPLRGQGSAQSFLDSLGK